VLNAGAQEAPLDIGRRRLRVKRSGEARPVPGRQGAAGTHLTRAAVSSLTREMTIRSLLLWSSTSSSTQFGGGLPLSMARVEVPAVGLATTTDARGNFALYGVPQDAEIWATKEGYTSVVDSVHLVHHKEQKDFWLSKDLSAVAVLTVSPSSVAPGGELRVSWTFPDYYFDRIWLVRVGDGDDDDVARLGMGAGIAPPSHPDPEQQDAGRQAHTGQQRQAQQRERALLLDPLLRGAVGPVVAADAVDRHTGDDQAEHQQEHRDESRHLHTLRGAAGQNR